MLLEDTNSRAGQLQSILSHMRSFTSLACRPENLVNSEMGLALIPYNFLSQQCTEVQNEHPQQCKPPTVAGFLDSAELWEESAG